MADDAKTLPERRRELLRRRIAESGMAAKESAGNPTVRAGVRYQLSTGQRRMWFLQAMDAADATLNIGVAFRLTGALDEARLAAAFSEVVARHAILRTTYGMDDEGEPYQVIQESVEVPWQTHDLTNICHSGRSRWIESVAADEFGRSFDLTNELPLRITLMRTGTAELVLLLVVHHICWDDDSWDVLLPDLSAAYNGRQPSGQAPQFVAVEVLGCPAEPSQDDLDYWRRTLRPLPDPVELLAVAAANPSKRSERRTRALPTGLFGRVETFAREHSASPFMVLLAVFGVLMRRYTAAADLLIAVPVTQRGAAADVIGYFGNTLLLRIAPRSQDTFTSFVGAVRDACLDGFAHQSVGIDRVVREANPERSMGRDGMDQLVQLGFSMRKSANRFALEGVAAEQLELGGLTAQLPLALAVVLDPEGVSIEFEYQSDVVAGLLADQMLAHYVRLLDNALSAPERRLANLDMLGAGGRVAILAQSHGELVDTPATTMVTLLESAAQSATDAAPDAVALVLDDPANAELTYAQLHSRANRLARWFIGNGIGTEDIIGLRMTTSVEFVVAMLAVLKAGAAYLPIDPAYPDDRIEYLVMDSRPKTVVGQPEFDAAESAAADFPGDAVTDADRLRPLRPEHLAYVIYTSGSTGRPKGVAVTHHAIAEHVQGFIAEWSMTAEDRLLQSSSVSFDASLLDIVVTLSLGAQLVVPRPDAFGDIGYLADVITRRDVTVLHMVPSMLSTLLMQPQVGAWRALRHVPVGGEALPGEVADKFASFFDGQLRNHYGPTEAVVCSTHMLVKGPQGTGVVPIGVPNRNVYCYVLDAQLQPVPAGVVGELYLGGVQLARGYLGRPGLTAQRFVADPFAAGMRLYRSGDLVRRNVRGELEFVGRADEQVKVRGFRVELGEVESVIASHPAVRRCVVVAHAAETGPMLTAYLVPEVPIDLDDIRTHAASTLPAYMVPTAFAIIPEIPLTVSGKLDKRALPAPNPVALQCHREPATPTERRMCSIFAPLLGREHVSPDDSFFGLGGHSLLAARLVAQIRAEFGVQLNVRVVFDTPTPAGLAALLVGQFRAEFDIDLDAPDVEEDLDDAVCGAAPSRPELVEAVRPERIPLSYSQLAMWFQYRMEGASDIGNVAVALRIDGPLDITALTEALNDVVARHDGLRTNFSEHEGVPYQLVQPVLEVEVPVVKITADQLDEVVAELRRHVFTPESEPLIRPTLLALGPHAHVLFVLMLHLVTDHASLGIFVEDLIVAYRARVVGKAPQWTALPIQYADYAQWQRAVFRSPSPREGACLYADTPSGDVQTCTFASEGTDHDQGEWGRAELKYWCGALAGLPGEISVAPDHPRPPVLGKRGEVVNFTVPAARRAALTALARQYGATEFMVYQAAFAVLQHNLGGGTDIPIGTPVASRVEPASANLIGLFANMVVLRNDLSGDPRLGTMITRSREVVLDAFAHQELPIERLVEALNPARSRSRNPLFQSMIHFRGADWALVPRELVTGETTVVPLPMDLEVSFLDLNLGMYVTADGGLDVCVVANAELYEPDTVRLIADALDTALEAFATTPDCPVSALQLLPAAALRRLLAPPNPALAAPSRPIIRGSAQTEQTLIALLEELLDVTGVEPDDNFFALGGDSIISIQWAARAAARGLALTAPMVFEHMTIAELAAAVDAAIDQTVDEGDSARRQESDAIALSPLQEGLFGLYRLAEGSLDLYTMQFVVDIDGPVDVPLLRRSVQAMLDRHPNLRATFRDHNLPKPVQIVPAATELPFAERTSNPTEFDSIARSERHRPFDLSRGPALRILLLTVPGEARHRMIFTTHHILMDGWSVAVFFTEMLAVYQAGGSLAGLPTRRPYRDYISWLSQQDSAAAIAKWSEYLGSLSGPLMVADGTVEMRDGLPEQTELLLPAVDTARLRQWAGRNGFTLNTVVLFAWIVVLGRLTDRRDIVVGTVVSGRPEDLAGVQSMVGLFINTVPVVHHLSSTASVAEQCTRLQRELSTMRDIGYLSLSELQREHGRGALFDTLFVFENAPIKDAIRPVSAPDGARFYPVGMESLAHYPLTVVSHLREDALVVLVEAICAALPHLRPEEIGKRLLAVLRQLPDVAENAPDKLDVLTPAERAECYQPAAQRVPTRYGATVWEMFERQAQATPDALALSSGAGERYTYAELHADASRLASELAAQGVGPEAVVALVLPRSTRHIVAMLAVLAAGGAYLPVDITLPHIRIEAIVRHANPILAVTETCCSQLVGARLRTLVLDDPVVAERISRRVAAAPTVRRHPEHCAYVIFTSGSTGEPKGVIGTNAALISYFADHRDRVYRPARTRLGRPLRIAHAWSLSFDASWQPMVGLLDGHALHLFDAEEMGDADRIVNGMASYGIDMIDTTPSMFVQLGAAGLANRNLSVLALGGEAVAAVLWERLRALSETAVYNCYGPTETTVEAVVAPVAEYPTPTIGTANTGTYGYVLDSMLRPVPNGVVGELYLAGAQLARGYIGGSAATAGRFIADPLRPGHRMYRTGDLVRRLPHGGYAYVGRADTQVKIRGYRVEIGEIEAALGSRPGVDAAAVSVVRHAGGVSLVGFVVRQDDPDDDSIELRAALAELLPPYMVPARVVALPALPMDVNGKLDTKTLDRLAEKVICAGVTGSAPGSVHTETEKSLSEVFAELFDGKIPDVDADFFSLGIDSIVAISLANKARRRGITLSPRMVLSAPSIRRLAAAIDAVADADSALESARYGGVPPLPMVSWLYEYGNYRRFTHTVLLQPPPEINRVSVELMLQLLLDGHDTLRSILVDTPDGPRLATREPGVVRAADLLSCIELPESTPAELGPTITAAARRAIDEIDPRAGAMVRAVWFRGAELQVLLITAHHLAVDVVSWHIMLADIAEAWRSLKSGAAPETPPELTSYRRWSQLMWQRAGTPAVSAQREYWAAQVGRPDPALGVRLPDPACDTWSTLRVTPVVTPVAVTERVLATLTRDEGVREFLLAVTTMVMASWRRNRGQDPASGTLISLEGHGRADAVLDTDTTNTVGWFTSAFPVRLGAGAAALDVERAEHDPGLARAVLDAVATQLRSIPNEGLDYGLLRYVENVPELREAGEPQIQFSYLGRLDLAGAPDQPWSLFTGALDALPIDPEPDLPLRFALNIGVLIGTTPQGPQLITNWRWSDALFTAADIDRLTDFWQRGVAVLAAVLDRNAG